MIASANVGAIENESNVVGIKYRINEHFLADERARFIVDIKITTVPNINAEFRIQCFFGRVQQSWGQKTRQFFLKKDFEVD